jgi:hypothetical protein
VNNPILITLSYFKCQKPAPYLTNLENKIAEVLKQATGFNLKTYPSLNCDLPFSSLYVVLSELMLTTLSKESGLNMADHEIRELLEMIDLSLFDSPLVRGLRRAQSIGSSVLYRDRDDPVTVDFPPLLITILSSKKLSTRVRFMDSSLVHLLGVIPVKLAESKDLSLFGFENGLWSSIYSLECPSEHNLKWIWDLDSASLVEVSKF